MRKLLNLFILLSFIKSEAQEIFGSDFHKNHGGQIVFNKETSPNEKTAKDFIVDFDSKDDITAYVYMKNTIQNYDLYSKTTSEKINPIERKYFIKYFIDDVDQDIKGTLDALNGKYEGLTAFTIRILRKTGNVSHNDFRNKILKLKGGKHTIRLEMWGGNGKDNSTKEPIAKGEFTLNKIDFVEQSIGSYNTIKAEMINPDLEKQAQKLVNEQSAAEGLGSKYSKPKIVHSDWGIVKNEITSKIICRTIRIVFYEVNTKGICRAVYFRFKQDYTGGGKYSNTLIYNGMGVSDRVDCE